MSAYSIVNLKEEVEDSMGERAPEIEGRFARKHLDSEHLGISYLLYSPGVRSRSVLCECLRVVCVGFASEPCWLAGCGAPSVTSWAIVGRSS
jgi:hypothetical protein